VTQHTRRGARLAALGLLAFAALAAVAAGDRLAIAKPRPKSGPARTCYDCHAASKQEFAKAKFVHAPVAKADCAACHQSHGFTQ